MGIASMVHIYVFPAKPYELMGDRLPGTVSVLGDYASVDCPLDPEEVRDSERPTKLRIPQPPDVDFKSGMNIKESVRDVFLGGGEYVSAYNFLCVFAVLSWLFIWLFLFKLKDFMILFQSIIN